MSRLNKCLKSILANGGYKYIKSLRVKAALNDHQICSLCNKEITGDRKFTLVDEKGMILPASFGSMSCAKKSKKAMRKSLRHEQAKLRQKQMRNRRLLWLLKPIIDFLVKHMPKIRLGA